MSRKCGAIPLYLLGAAVSFAIYAEMQHGDREPDGPDNAGVLVALNNEMIRAHVCGDRATPAHWSP